MLFRKFFIFFLIILLSFIAVIYSQKKTDDIYYYLTKSNLYEAEKLIYEILKDDPLNKDALFAKSILLYKYTELENNKDIRKEKLEKSLQILNNLQKNLTGFYYYHFIKAKVLENLNNFDEAIKEYDNSIYYNRKFIDSYIGKSLLLWKMNKISDSIQVLNPVRDNYKVKILQAWYLYQQNNYEDSLKTFMQILDNPLNFNKLRENREVLNELYFQIMWIGYRANKNLTYWIEQNKKYNTNDYYNSICQIIEIEQKNEEEAVRKGLYNISLYPNKPYSYFIVYKILKKHSKNQNKNYIYFLNKAVESDPYNLDFKNLLKMEMENKK